MKIVLQSDDLLDMKEKEERRSHLALLKISMQKRKLAMEEQEKKDKVSARLQEKRTRVHDL